MRDNFDKFTLSIAFLALVFSGGSLYFSWFVYNQSNREQLAIISTPNAKNYRTYLSSNPTILTTEWNLIISNNSDKSTSIVKYSTSKLTDVGNDSWYTGLQQGIFDENYNEITLPIDIEPGKSRRVIIKVGMWLSSSAQNIFKKSKIKKGNISIKAVTDTLFKNHLDFYDNEVDAQYFHDTLLIVKWPNKTLQKVYKATFVTAKGSEFTSELKLYQFEDQ